MSTSRDRGDNPAGLATFDPMRHENYRKAVRAVSDGFHRLKCIPPLPRFEDRQPLQSSEGKVGRNQQDPAR